MIKYLIKKIFFTRWTQALTRRYLDFCKPLNHAELQRLNIFDSGWYFQQYEISSTFDPYVHFMLYGWRYGLDMSCDLTHDKLQRLLPGYQADTNPIKFIRKLDENSLKEFVSNFKVVNAQTSSNEEYPLKNGICLMGYFLSEIGLGQAVRNMAYAIDNACIPSSYFNIPLISRSNDIEFRNKCGIHQDREVSMMLLGLPSIQHYVNSLKGGRLNIAYPYWELSNIPAPWKEHLLKFDEVLAPTKFIGDALSKVLNRPIDIMPQVVRVPSSLKKLSSPSVMNILAFLDFDSHTSRKNPKGVLDAFKLAFSIKNEDVALTVKVRGNDDEGGRDLLRKYAAHDRRIKIIDETLDRSGMDQLYADCDVYISMHRSEGFGFGVAEALSVGKVVIATNYSGTTDFLNETTGYPVAYDLVSLKKGDYPEWRDQVWANPSVDDAARILKDVHSNWQNALAKARLGKEYVLNYHSAAAVGQTLRELLIKRGLSLK